MALRLYFYVPLAPRVRPKDELLSGSVPEVRTYGKQKKIVKFCGSDDQNRSEGSTVATSDVESLEVRVWTIFGFEAKWRQ
ncbi:unnamed protein product [Lasius platythorax]|uniref:Uncharacterized protein n=1 Tax=Lasius platythorax TaxID=488582 RepID=A0AAV2NYN0_9HYME